MVVCLHLIVDIFFNHQHWYLQLLFCPGVGYGVCSWATLYMQTLTTLTIIAIYNYSYIYHYITLYTTDSKLCSITLNAVHNTPSVNCCVRVVCVITECTCRKRHTRTTPGHTINNIYIIEAGHVLY